MTNRKKIVVFSPDMHGGGVANVVYHTLQMYADNPDYDSSLIVYDDTQINFQVASSVSVFRLNIPYYVTTASTKLGKLLRSVGRILLFPIALLKARQILKKVKPDVIITHGILCNIIAVLSKGDSKIVLVEHGVPFKLVPSSALLSNLLLFVNRKIYRRVDHFVAISDLIQLNFRDKFHLKPEQIHKIVNPVNLEKIRTKIHEEVAEDMNLIFDRHRVLVTACRLIEQKSIETMVEAVRYLNDKGHHDFKVLIIGDGPLKNSLSNLIKQYKLEDRIYLAGFQSNPYKYIYKSFAYLSSSIYEGYPVSIIEAISIGKPVIATDCESGPREILGISYQKTGNIEVGQCGVLTPLDTIEGKPVPDSAAFAEGMMYVLSHDELYENFCANAKEFAKKNDVKQIALLWYKLIDQL